MTKMKKLFAVVLALAMLVTMASFSASAEGEEPVSLTVSPSAVNYNGGMRVSLNVDDSVVGGVQTIITYDKDAVKLVSKSVTNTTNNTLVNTVLDDGNGNIKVVTLGGGVVFEFAVLSTNEKASVTFTATNVKASNLNGDGYVEVKEAALSATAAISTEKTVMPVMLGTQLRKTNNPDNLHLGFTAEIANLGENTITKVGLVVIPTALLNGDAPENLTAETPSVLTAELEGDAAADFTTEKFVGYIKNTASTALMGKSFTARYYITVAGSDEKIYSTNFTFDSKGEATASYGVAKKSAVKQLGMYAKKIAANAIAENVENASAIEAAANQVISDYNATKSDDAKEALINFVFDNRGLLG